MGIAVASLRVYSAAWLPPVLAELRGTGRFPILGAVILNSRQSQAPLDDKSQLPESLRGIGAGRVPARADG